MRIANDLRLYSCFFDSSTMSCCSCRQHWKIQFWHERISRMCRVVDLGPVNLAKWLPTHSPLEDRRWAFIPCSLRYTIEPLLTLQCYLMFWFRSFSAGVQHINWTSTKSADQHELTATKHIHPSHWNRLKQPQTSMTESASIRTMPQGNPDWIYIYIFHAQQQQHTKNKQTNKQKYTMKISSNRPNSSFDWQAHATPQQSNAINYILQMLCNTD